MKTLHYELRTGFTYNESLLTKDQAFERVKESIDGLYAYTQMGPRISVRPSAVSGDIIIRVEGESSEILEKFRKELSEKLIRRSKGWPENGLLRKVDLRWVSSQIVKKEESHEA